MIKPQKLIIFGDEVFEELFVKRYGVLELKNEAIKIIGLGSSEPDSGHGKIGRLQRKSKKIHGLQ